MDGVFFTDGGDFWIDRLGDLVAYLIVFELESGKSHFKTFNFYSMKNSFEKLYPFLHLYLCYHGSIELGAGEYADSWVRLMDEGGTRLECDKKTLDESLKEAEEWAEEWMRGNYEEVVKKEGL